MSSFFSEYNISGNVEVTDIQEQVEGDMPEEEVDKAEEMAVEDMDKAVDTA